jgi:hypothetical protein
MRGLIWMVAGAIALCIAVGTACAVFLKTWADGFSARAQPSVLEGWVERQARSMALPADARTRGNPIGDSPEFLAEAPAHWADHCAVCHSNNGSGVAEMGKHMYPPAPDMRQPDTQNLSDGELFYIIQNGIHITGMPRGEVARATMSRIRGNSSGLFATSQNSRPRKSGKCRHRIRRARTN